MRNATDQVNSSGNSCPLCKGSVKWFAEDQKRSYWQCDLCQLVHVPKPFHLSSNDEKAEYDKHQNSPSDPGYQRFLSRVSGPLIKRLTSGAKGLDFGCGPGPVLALMMQQAGFEMSLYDPFYFPNSNALKQTYDFICCTEVIEHVANPRQVLSTLAGMMKPAAILAIMTKRVKDLPSFTRWHYKNDPTHIAFYSLATFEWIAQELNLSLQVIGDDVVFLVNSRIGS